MVQVFDDDLRSNPLIPVKNFSSVLDEMMRGKFLSDDLAHGTHWHQVTRVLLLFTIPRSEKVSLFGVDSS